MTTRTIQLYRSNTAAYGEISYTAHGNRWGPIAPLIRQLLYAGLIEPNDVVEVRRGEMLCQSPRLAIRWAEVDIIDDPRNGLVRRPASIGPYVKRATRVEEAPSPTEGRFQGDRAAAQPQTRSPG